MKIEIIRIEQSDYHTLGILIIDQSAFCCTLEREWKDNKPNESCIPAGEYICKSVLSPKFSRTFEITKVPNRSAILFHAGNYPENSHGCVLLGASFLKLKERRFINNSGETFKKFLEYFKQLSIKEFQLTILDFIKR